MTHFFKNLSIRYSILLALSLAACQKSYIKEDLDSYKSSSDLTSLNVQLSQATADLQRLQQKISQLKEEIAFTQVSRIRRVVEAFASNISEQNRESKNQDLASLFEDERRILDKIINENPTLSQAAQEALDEILIVITYLSNS